MSTHPSLQVTPPQSFTSSPPLTPPPTSEKASHVVASIVAEIKARRSGHSRLTAPWAKYPLNEHQYGDLERQVQSDEALLGYVKDEPRYMSNTSGMLTWLIYPYALKPRQEFLVQGVGAWSREPPTPYTLTLPPVLTVRRVILVLLIHYILLPDLYLALRDHLLEKPEMNLELNSPRS